MTTAASTSPQPPSGTTPLHPELATLLGFLREARADSAGPFRHRAGLIPNPTFFSVASLQRHLNNPLLHPDWAALVYRGQVVPVIDLHRLAGSGECPLHLSSRIILVPHGGQESGGAERLLGLLATQVADIREVPDESMPANYTATGRADLGAVLADGSRVVRVLALERLLPDAAWRQLRALPAESSP